MGIVKDLATAGRPKTAKELSSSSGGDELLISRPTASPICVPYMGASGLTRWIVRLMRPLCVLGVFRETDVQTYASTPISELLISPPLIGGYQFMSVWKRLGSIQS